MSKKYKNPPIIEALCEFRFQPGLAWDMAFPERIYESVKDSFPKRKLAQSYEASVAFAPEGNRQHLKSMPRWQFLRADEKALIQVEANLLSVNHLKPYPSWPEFLPIIRQAYDAYRAIAEPKGLHRIGLRYINQIEIAGNQIVLEEYFNFFPTLNWQAPGQGFVAFSTGVHIPFDDARDILKLQMASGASNNPDALDVLLDIDYFTGKSGEVGFDQAFDWIEQAHLRVGEAFEGCITDSLRKLFGEEAK
ncbi:MAG: TIGR04255 family protein [Blastocatellales bacterium]